MILSPELHPRLGCPTRTIFVPHLNEVEGGGLLKLPFIRSSICLPHLEQKIFFTVRQCFPIENIANVTSNVFTQTVGVYDEADIAF